MARLEEKSWRRPGVGIVARETGAGGHLLSAVIVPEAAQAGIVTGHAEGLHRLGQQVLFRRGMRGMAGVTPLFHGLVDHTPLERPGVVTGEAGARLSGPQQTGPIRGVGIMARGTIPLAERRMHRRGGCNLVLQVAVAAGTQLGRVRLQPQDPHHPVCFMTGPAVLLSHRGVQMLLPLKIFQAICVAPEAISRGGFLPAFLPELPGRLPGEEECNGSRGQCDPEHLGGECHPALFPAAQPPHLIRVSSASRTIFCAASVVLSPGTPKSRLMAPAPPRDTEADQRVLPVSA